MTRAAQKLLDEARALSVEEREEIAHGLLDSVAAERNDLDPEWRSEIGRRIKQVERGEVELIDGDEVLRELREQFPDR